MKSSVKIQTKEDIRQLMIDALHYSIPEIKSYQNYPIIVTNDNEDENSILKGGIYCYWLWILPNGSGVSYGKNGKNTIIYIPHIKDNVNLANVGYSCAIDVYTKSYNQAEIKLTVKKAIYKTEDKTPQMVVCVESPDLELKDISCLFSKTYQTEFL